MIDFKSRILFKGKIENGKVLFDYPTLFESRKSMLEGNRFQMTFDAEEKPKTPSQLGYYFGGIIEATCMQSTAFEGWTKDEIHEYLVKRLRSYPKELHYPDGHKEIENCTEEVRDYKMDEWAKYIDDVIRYLTMHHQITPLSPEDYKYEKYQKFINPHKEEKEW